MTFLAIEHRNETKITRNMAAASNLVHVDSKTDIASSNDPGATSQKNHFSKSCF